MSLLSGLRSTFKWNGKDSVHMSIGFNPLMEEAFDDWEELDRFYNSRKNFTLPPLNFYHFCNYLFKVQKFSI